MSAMMMTMEDDDDHEKLKRKSKSHSCRWLIIVSGSRDFCLVKNKAIALMDFPCSVP